jgi:hypothetical protein
MCNNVLSLSLTIAVRPPLWSSIFYLIQATVPEERRRPGRSGAVLRDVYRVEVTLAALHGKR